MGAAWLLHSQHGLQWSLQQTVRSLFNSPERDLLTATERHAAATIQYLLHLAEMQDIAERLISSPLSGRETVATVGCLDKLPAMPTTSNA